MAEIYVTQPRKAFYYEPPAGWIMTHHARFDFIECAIYSKPSTSLTDEDREEIEARGNRPQEWVEPSALEAEQ